MKKFLISSIILVFALACGSVDSESTVETKTDIKEGMTVVNGVERSELALTMREMYDQMKLASDSLKNGQHIETNYLERFKTIHTDHATEPEKIDEVYQGMASAFLESYSAFESADSNRVVLFNQMLDACLACHQQKCPGPIKAIKKLKLNAG